MAITPSGQVKFSDLRTEFIGGSGQVPIGSLYRGGSNIRAKSPGNNATNDAAAVPTSGELQLSDYYGTAKGFTFTYSSSATDQNLSSLFGSTDYGVDYPKNVVIPSSVTLGTNNTSEYALEANSGGAGTITITNNGSIIGAGGGGGSGGSVNSGTGGNGSSGGDAFKASVAVTLVNNGSMLAGGGGGSGGGGGGVGGNLSQQQQQTATQGPFYGGPGNNFYAWATAQSFSSYPAPVRFTPYGFPSQLGTTIIYPDGRSRIQFGPASGAPSFPEGPLNRTSFTQGQYTYNRGAQQGGVQPVNKEQGENQFQIGRRVQFAVYRTFPQSQQTQVAGHSGGAGGAGGLGRGFNNQPGGDAGSGGSAGATGQAGNGGAGGTGGTGGGYGQAGSAGATGATGTPSTTSGTAGGAGGSVGAAGKYIEGISNVTFTNNGTVAGGTE